MSSTYAVMLSGFILGGEYMPPLGFGNGLKINSSSHVLAPLKLQCPPVSLILKPWSWPLWYCVLIVSLLYSFFFFRFYTSTVPMSSHEFTAVELSLISLTVVGCMIMLTCMANFNCYCYYHFIMILCIILYFHFLHFLHVYAQKWKCRNELCKFLHG